MVDVDINFRVKRLDTIEELKSSYQIRLMMVIHWFDPRLTYVNLRNLITSNIVEAEIASSLWTPPLVIPGALTSYNLAYEEKSYLLVNKTQQNGQTTGVHIVHEGIQFEGGLNPLTLVKELQLKHSCTFELRNYPFDVQFCKLKVYLYVPETNESHSCFLLLLYR